MTSAELNAAIAAICDDTEHYEPIKGGLYDTGKVIPYIGWYWRDVDFDAPYVVLGDCGFFIGFMENNKWGYPQCALDGEHSALIRDRLIALVQAPTQAGLQAFYDFLQTYRGGAGWSADDSAELNALLANL